MACLLLDDTERNTNLVQFTQPTMLPVEVVEYMQVDGVHAYLVHTIGITTNIIA